MRLIQVLTLVFASVFFFQARAEAAIVTKVDISSQTMNVYIDGVLKHSWPVSTARRGYFTPTGVYRVQSLQAMHYSRKYDNSPMPHSIFFRGGFAIHGTGAVGQLGRPASHGCVRLAPGNAATLFSLVRQHGGSKIIITH